MQTNPLHVSIKDGGQRKVDELLHNGADLNETDANGRTALHLAVEEGNRAMVSLLLAHGANPNNTDANGLTPLDIAVQKGTDAIVVLLNSYLAQTEDDSHGYCICTYTIPLRNVVVSRDLGAGIQVASRMWLTNDSQAFGDESEVCGANDMHGWYRSSRVWLYGSFALRVPERYLSPVSRLVPRVHESLPKRLATAESLIRSLWLMKDNCVSMGVGLLRIDVRPPEQLRWKSYIEPRFSATMADGQRDKIVHYNVDEVTAAVYLSKKHKSILDSDPFNALQVSLVSPAAYRIRNALYFVHLARSTSDLGLKVAHYCSALEALFSVGKDELRHRVAENAAFFQGKDSKQRRELYQQIKAAYDIRSRVIHGGISPMAKQSKNEKIQKEIETAAKSLDSILRLVLSGVLTFREKFETFSLDDEKRRDYFERRIFGNDTES
jgi:hypothetical protein